MKIQEVRAYGLYGRTPEGGWSNELRPEDCVHTIIAVLTDEGLTGWGSVFTSVDLVRASLAVLRPLYQNENALEPERVSEKLHQNTFWQGRGGAITHTISGIDIALWDILGKATGQPVGRLLGWALPRPRAALRLAPHDRARPARREPPRHQVAGLPGIQDRVGALRQTRRRHRRGHRPGGARGDRPRRPAPGRRGRQRRLLDAGLQVGPEDGGDAGGPRRGLVRGAAAPRRAGGLRSPPPRGTPAHHGRRDAHAPPVVPSLPRGRGLRHGAT